MPAAPNSDPPTRPPSNRALRERVRTYLLGVGIGLLLVGLLWFARGASNPPAPASDQVPVSKSR